MPKRFIPPVIVSVLLLAGLLVSLNATGEASPALASSARAGSVEPALAASDTVTYYQYLPLVLKNWPTYNGTVEIIDHREIDHTRIVVLLENRGVTATLVKVEADTWGYGDGSTGHGTGYPYLSVVRPGERACLRIVPIPVGGWTTYTVQITQIVTDPAASRAVLEVTSVNPTQDHVTGQIRNDTQHTARYVRAVATLYDGSGHILNCGYDFVSPSTLAPGEEGEYDVYFVDNPEPPARAVVQTDGVME